MQIGCECGHVSIYIVIFFIIPATGTALYGAGVNKIDTVEQAAKALEPVAGEGYQLLFTIGVMGTGLSYTSAYRLSALHYCIDFWVERKSG